MPFFFWDSTMLLLIPALLFGIWAQWKVKSTFKRYSKIPSNSGMTGYQVAKNLLERNNIFDVEVEEIQGSLTDHYDSKEKKLRLSEQNFRGSSVASIGVAAHEVGHAIQDNRGYAPLRWRLAFYPVARLGSGLWFWLFLAGMILTIPALIDVGIIFFATTLVFQIVTLPVEFNASSRALAQLSSGGFITKDDSDGAKAVLNAAAMTYLAAAAMALSQLVRLLILRGRN
ncbi:MAG: zinc metallopeptidase [Candidatus Marinimicrobia bacterium]|nr:zinc metallopeptidase [Candidatus Neomarinimicrobiota bacterium]TFB10313.1 zinc metallopeptidase [Candidatus Marinimicrobia bacterium MT.SAG.2]